MFWPDLCPKLLENSAGRPGAVQSGRDSFSPRSPMSTFISLGTQSCGSVVPSLHFSWLSPKLISPALGSSDTVQVLGG